MVRRLADSGRHSGALRVKEIVNSVCRRPLGQLLSALTLCTALVVPRASQAQLGKGFNILLNRGLQIQAMVTPDNYFHPDTFSNANYTAVNFFGDSNGNLGPPSVFLGPAPGAPRARGGVDENNKPTQGTDSKGVARTYEIPYTNQLINIQLGDEWDLNDDATRTRLVNWLVSVRTNWPNTILYHNNWGGQIADAQLADYLTRAQPDMISFDAYPWQNVYTASHDGPPIPGPGSGQIAYWLASLRQDREYARAYGIPLALYRQTFHSVQDYNSTDYRNPSKSELRYNTFVALAFNAKCLFDFTYNTGASSLFTNAFGGAGDSYPSTNGLYTEMIDVNKRARNLGRALTRLTAITTEGVSGYTSSILIIRGKDANGNLTPVPTGFQAPNVTNTYWKPLLNDTFLATWSVTNIAHIRNNGYPGDVFIAWFKPLNEALDGTSYNSQTYFMVVNGLTDPNGTAADCKQRINLDFNNPPQTSAVLLDPETGLLQTNNLTFALGNWRLTLDLNGGDAALFKLQTGAPFVGYVTPAKARLTPTVRTNGLDLSISGTVGCRYQLESSPSLEAPIWTAVTNQVFFSTPVVWHDAPPDGATRFYRVTGASY